MTAWRNIVSWAVPNDLFGWATAKLSLFALEEIARQNIASMLSSRSYFLQKDLYNKCPWDTQDSRNSIRAGRDARAGYETVDIAFDGDVNIRVSMDTPYAPYILGRPGSRWFDGRKPGTGGYEWWDSIIEDWAYDAYDATAQIWEDITEGYSFGVEISNGSYGVDMTTSAVLARIRRDSQKRFGA